MNLDTLRVLYLEPFKNLKADVTGFAQADRHLNLAYLEVYRAHRWNVRKKTGQILLIPRYTSGTVTTTVYDGTNEDSAKTVGFSSALNNSFLGRYIKFAGGSKWYKIIYLDGVTGYLDSPVIETPTDQTFEIWKRFYYIKSDAETFRDFGRWGDGKVNYDPDFIGKKNDISENVNGKGTPQIFSPYGIDPYDDIEYSTGQISVLTDSNVGIGIGTTWLSSGFETGDIVRLSNQDYFIKRIESNTRIIFQNYFPNVVPATSYSFHKNNPIGFEYYHSANAYDVLPYTYFGRAYPLIHPTKDRIALSDKFIPAIISRSQYYGMKSVDDQRAVQLLQIYTAEMEGLKSRGEVVDSRYDQFAPLVHSQSPGRG